MTELGRPEITVQILDAHGAGVTEIDAGAPLTIRVTGYPPPNGKWFHAELQVRHLESGVVIYRSQSRAAGAGPVALQPGDGMEILWSIFANLGRGHYAISCAIVNENHRWVAVSAPMLLTINERRSEQAVVHLDARCVVRTLNAVPESAVAGRPG